MALPENSTIYRTRNWEDEYKKTRFGSSDNLTNRQMRQFNRFARSKQGEAARLVYDKAEMDKFNKSVDDAIANAKTQREATVKEFNKKYFSTPVSAPAPAPTPATETVITYTPGLVSTPVPVTPVTEPATTVTPPSPATAPEAGTPVLTSKPEPKSENTVSEEEKAAANAKRAADYQAAKEAHLRERQAAKPTPMTADQLRLHSNLRGHHSLAENATIIDGKKYPIVVTTGLLGQKYALKNDQTYAYDESTGMMRLVNENMFGLPTGTFAEGFKWFDPSKFLGGDEYNWLVANPMPSMHNEFGRLSSEYSKWVANRKEAEKTGFKKQGGIMNRINYFQQGGAAPQQDIKAQVTALVQAAMQGDQKATQQVNQIMEAAKAGDQQAIQIAQMMEQVIKELKGQATTAKWGSKLNYIKSLKYAKGGKTCPTCEKKVEMKACGGKKAKKRYFGGLV